MSTRSQVIIQDGPKDRVFFYRHSDGYPSGAGLSLVQFLKRFIGPVTDPKVLRRDATQASGHLVLHGREEYVDLIKSDSYAWKVGAYEPCTNKLFGDIEWLYIIDFETNTFKVYQTGFDFGKRQKTTETRIKQSKLVYETTITAEGLIDAQLKLKELE